MVSCCWDAIYIRQCIGFLVGQSIHFVEFGPERSKATSLKTGCWNFRKTSLDSKPCEKGRGGIDPGGNPT